MPRTRSNYNGFILCLGLFFLFVSNSQESEQRTTYLIPFIQKLENSFEVKFSYVDTDIRSVQINIPESEILDTIIQNIEDQTQLQIQKLNERYYTIARPNVISICGIVLDNFEQNTVTGATVQVLGTEKAVITDLDGSFTLNDIPRTANLQIKHIGFKTLFIAADKLLEKKPCKTLLLGQFY